jgi:hypothetical protein
MNIRYFPDQAAIEKAKQEDDPLLLMVAFDQQEALLATVDFASDHSTLIRKVGLPDERIDSFFRAILNRQGAEWIFVCPATYKDIPERGSRTDQYLNDGVDAFSAAIQAIGYEVKITIPSRFRWHFDELS